MIRLLLLATLPFLMTTTGRCEEQPWTRHVIDDSSRGADGVRLADINGDGLPDIATGWEEGGISRAYINPGPARSREKWPAVTVGHTRSVEDAVFVDLDRDGAADMVSCEEAAGPKSGVKWLSYAKPPLEPAWLGHEISGPAGVKFDLVELLDLDDDGDLDVLTCEEARNLGVIWYENPCPQLMR